MKSPNDKTIVPDAMGPDEEELELRALITVDLEEDEDVPPVQVVDEFSDEFLMQVPRRDQG